MYTNSITHWLVLNRPAMAGFEVTGDIIGDVPAPTAILDRFLHHAEVIPIKGKSYRLKDQACRQKD